MLPTLPKSYLKDEKKRDQWHLKRAEKKRKERLKRNISWVISSTASQGKSIRAAP